MKALLAAVFLLVPLAATAQGEPAAVEACRAYAKKELAREGVQAIDVVLERDATLALERSARKVGSQPVSAVLTGNGAVVLKAAPSVELSFLCLLADQKRAVFFSWLPRQHPSALAQCRRSPEVRAEARACLELLLRTAERDLGDAYAHRFQEANERGEAALAAYRRAADEWRQYRDAECARRHGLAPAGITPEDYQIACVVELTRRRALDMH
ncbi:MAG TPA: lysozyme inhibitor LprI family protein [Burkholderiales bacterium]|nr:lysozyme inhibitor LprI family protein [Burkholderiales bacterium]